MKKLEIKSVSKKFGTVNALLDVSLVLMPGELFFLLGPSGCGKTTLLRIIAGLETPDTGSVLLDDNNITALPSEKRTMGMVFQNYALWPHMTVFENIAYGLKRRKTNTKELHTRVGDILDKTGLSSLSNRKPTTLSGGQQQRVALSRALVYNPEIVLFDEPLSNLDAQLRGELRAQIRELHAALGITMVYVTHDQEEVHALAQRAALMMNGTILQVDTPPMLFSKPNSNRAAQFFGRRNIFTVSITEVSQTITTVLLGSCKLTLAHKENASALNSTITLLIPEEKIILTESKSHETNCFEGTIISLEISSQTKVIGIQIHNIVLYALCLNSASYHMSQALFVEIPCESVWIIPDE